MLCPFIGPKFVSPLTYIKEESTIYFPQNTSEESQVLHVGNLFTIRLLEFKRTKNLGMSRLLISSLLHPEEPELEVNHYHETNWEDDKAMDQFTDIDEMIALIQEARELHPQSPVVVHCSAGLGRTGTLICIYAIMEAFKTLKEINVAH